MRIQRVTIIKEIDQDPDCSYLGGYSNTPGPEAIDRQERRDMGRNEYRYFLPANTAAETGNPESPEQDYQRCEAYNRGEWNYIGLHARAEVTLTDEGPQQVLTSGGLWGIESDSEPGYLAEVANEELTQLRAELEAVGFSETEINTAFATAEV